ncbi:hypothetical protein [Macrococcus bovicus]|uniref:hypothetical protein n=1 Tax=Macrococcus bovicus TaxID=69968 RepID=UPI0025A614C2|nr:hypothetical protein [Macrococcus bovicus]WJP96712.1 hypothetical protein QSV55_00300 [Macrococcus bovicus]
MIWIMIITLTVLLAWSLYRNDKVTDENAALKYELERTMRLVDEATKQGFKL